MGIIAGHANVVRMVFGGDLYAVMALNAEIAYNTSPGHAHIWINPKESDIAASISIGIDNIALIISSPMGTTGIEPVTFSLSGRCSTSELCALVRDLYCLSLHIMRTIMQIRNLAITDNAMADPYLSSILGTIWKWSHTHHH